MSNEVKKLAVFGLIISLLTSTYVTFLGTILRQGFATENFIYNWLSLVPKAYIAVLPFVLITGPLVRRFVDWIFVNLSTTHNK
ncbi:MAG: DUF2798 domain-containing protein [Bacteroidota bacterium]